MPMGCGHFTNEVCMDVGTQAVRALWVFFATTTTEDYIWEYKASACFLGDSWDTVNSAAVRILKTKHLKKAFTFIFYFPSFIRTVHTAQRFLAATDRLPDWCTETQLSLYPAMSHNM